MTLERTKAPGEAWQTTVEQAGSLPDPTGQPDGDVLTIVSGVPAWAPSGGSQPVLQFVDVQLDDATIKTLLATPVEVIPAPGPGLSILMLANNQVLDARNGAYTTIDDSQALAYFWDGDFDGGVYPSPVPAIRRFQDFGANLVSAATSIGTEPTINNVREDTAMYLGLGAFSTDEEWGGGGTGNTFSDRIFYVIVPVLPFTP